MSDDDAGERYNAELAQMLEAARGREVDEAERIVREWAARRAPYVEDCDLQLLARAIADPRWAQHHPLAAAAFAWKHRRSRPLHRTLKQLWRPTYAG